MKSIFLVSIFAIAIITLQCTSEEEPYFVHLYGYVIEEADSTTGVNDLLLRIWHLNPDNPSQTVLLDTIRTKTQDEFDGFFERDSVCYGTSQKQGQGYVAIVVDSTQNPGWPSQLWTPEIYGDVDTVTLYIQD
jgi:hypothetical protein